MKVERSCATCSYVSEPFNSINCGKCMGNPDKPNWVSSTKEEYEVDSKFKVGNLVRVVDTGEEYPHYNEWIERLCSSFKDKWSDGRDLEMGYIGKVVFVGKHLDDLAIICLIEVDSKVYIISENGLELVENKFKVGDIIIGNNNYCYAVTDEDSVCEVVNVFNETEIEVKVIEHKRLQYCIGNTYDVKSEYFDLISDVSDVEDVNLVYIKYPNNSKTYLFLVPNDVILCKGESVFVNSKYGEDIGVCHTNSFNISPKAYSQIIRGSDLKISQMKTVTAKAIKQDEYRRVEF